MSENFVTVSGVHFSYQSVRCLRVFFSSLQNGIGKAVSSFALCLCLESSNVIHILQSTMFKQHIHGRSSVTSILAHTFKVGIDNGTLSSPCENARRAWTSTLGMRTTWWATVQGQSATAPGSSSSMSKRKWPLTSWSGLLTSRYAHLLSVLGLLLLHSDCSFPRELFVQTLVK